MKNKQYFNLTKLLTLSLLGSILNALCSSKNKDLPRKIGDYILESNFQKLGSKNNYLLGIYKNSKNQKAFAKIWSGRFKDLNYYSLKNEIQVSQTLNSVIKRSRKLLPKSLKKMGIPVLISFEEKDDCLTVLTEYVEGELATSLSTNRKIDLYFKTVEFLKFLGSRLTPVEKKLISKRTPLNFAMLYPLLITKAIFSHPRATFYILKGIPIFLQSLPVLFKEKQLTLSHRDLHFRNILISKEINYVIDLQFCAFTHPIHEITTTLRYRWGEEKNFCTRLLKEIIKINKENKQFQLLLRSLIINSATHGLTDKGFSKEKIDSWIDFLKFAIKHDYQVR